MPEAAPDSAARVQLRDGRLHIPGATYEQHLAGCVAVALTEREGHWWLLPLRAGAGGLQIKQRNPRGDRVVETQEFFRSQGLEDSPLARDYALLPDVQLGAFRLGAVDS